MALGRDVVRAFVYGFFCCVARVDDSAVGVRWLG